MDLLVKQNKGILGNTVLIIVAETFEHMEYLTTLGLNYERHGLDLEILYTHDSDWFYELPGNFYVMAHAMGQSGLMNVKLI